MDMQAAFNLSDIDVKHRLHLNENPSNDLWEHWSALADEFKRASIYPDPASTKLREKLGLIYGISPKSILVSNGTDEIILFLALTYLTKGGSSIISESTFPGYESATRIVGGECIKVPLKDMHCSVEAYSAGVDGSTRLAFLCNPHNPTGTILPKHSVLKFVRSMNEHGVVPVVDEAYIQFAGEAENSIVTDISDGLNAIVLRTFSKAYGLAGFRIGYAIAPDHLIAHLEATATVLPFRVNRFALRMAAEVLETQEVTKATQNVRRLVRTAMEGLTDAGIDVLPSSTNFICFKPRIPSEEFLSLTSSASGRVRDCSAFGLPGWIRASIATESDVQFLWRLNGLTSEL